MGRSLAGGSHREENPWLVQESDERESTFWSGQIAAVESQDVLEVRKQRFPEQQPAKGVRQATCTDGEGLRNQLIGSYLGSSTVTRESIFSPRSNCLPPLGQVISTFSTVVAVPSPKVTTSSLALR